MMNSRNSITKSGNRTSCFHGVSWQWYTQSKSNIDKIYVCTIKISLQLKLPYLGVGEGVHSVPPLGQGVGKMCTLANKSRVSLTLFYNCMLFNE